jgi:hypothetical protein
MTNHPNRNKLTAKKIRAIADESGFEHALFVAEQEATQRGKANMDAVFAELAKIEKEIYG